jgi:predicted GH43/DUF377 family glycosyl hydrolase
MVKKIRRDVVHRYKENPLIGIEELPFRCSDIRNAGVVYFEGEYLLLLTVETLEGLGNIYVARGKDGRHFSTESKPLLSACTCKVCSCYTTYGVLDPRVTHIDQTYYITYVAKSEHGQRVAIAQTENFRSIKGKHFISEPDTKSSALFPKKINGRYAMLQRPSAGGSIWIRYSDDLKYWGSSTIVMTPRSRYWDPTRIGTASPPIEIAEGWLLIYYGVKNTSAGPLVRLGAAILGRDDPSRVIARSNIPILSPREKYERIGDVGNFIFSCGTLLEGDKELKIYYGASDSCICLGTCTLEDVIHVCQKGLEEY